MIFLTGGTGFLGNALITSLFSEYPSEKMAVMVRASNELEAKNRIQESFKHLREYYPEEQVLSRIIPIKGNLSTEGLGLSDKDKFFLKSEVSSIYHSAANTHLSLPYEEAKATNLDGTVRLLELASEIAESNSSLRFNHISTAYVAGDTSEIVTADSLELKTRFRNSYEQTKAHAESLVRAHKDKFNIVIFRPSIIVGDSVTGRTSTFNVLYIPARIIIAGLLKVIPALPHIPFDVVPVDYVANCISKSHILDIPNGSSFHLSAGVGRESSPGEILELLFHTARNYSSKNIPQKPSFVSAEVMQRTIHSLSSLANNLYYTTAFRHFEKVVCEHIPVFRQLLPFIPYMVSNPRFDTNSTFASLGTKIEPAPLFNQYAENIFKYCIQSHWGKASPALSM